ncbi:MAG: SigB/SigF/SigG family RNA polymerase sigma factor [bacterium]
MPGPPLPGAGREAARDLLHEYWLTRDPSLREQLVLAHASLAAYLARKYAYRGEPLEDILQVAQVGLLGAIDRFDPTRGVEFSTFATATIIGEIKRYFRDKSWSVHVPRRLRELNNQLMRTMEGLSQTLGRSPTIPEIAGASGVPFETVVEALEVGQAYNPVSLDTEVAEPRGGAPSSLADYLGGDDQELRRAEERHTIEKVLAALPEQLQAIIRLRFYDDLPQAEIARRLGISQMHVSRLQREALRRMREMIA